MENIKQSLVELIADWLDSDQIKFEMGCSKISEPQTREDSDLHIKMAEAAMAVFEANTLTEKGLVEKLYLFADD